MKFAEKVLQQLHLDDRKVREEYLKKIEGCPNSEDLENAKKFAKLVIQKL